MSKDGKNKFYRQLKISTDIRKAIKLYRKFKRQVIQGAKFFNPNAPDFEKKI